MLWSQSRTAGAAFLQPRTIVAGALFEIHKNFSSHWPQDPNHLKERFGSSHLKWAFSLIL